MRTAPKQQATAVAVAKRRWPESSPRRTSDPVGPLLSAVFFDRRDVTPAFVHAAVTQWLAAI
jgi:hypothetical protein